MLDFIKDLSQVFLSGYVALVVFTYRQNRGFSRLDGEKYLMSLLALGMLSHFLFLIAKCGFQAGGWPTPGNTEIQILKFIFYVLSGVTVGGILSQNEILDFIETSSITFRQKKIPHPSSLFEEDMLDAIYIRPMPYLIETILGKFYVSWIRQVDIADSIPYDERIIKISPVRSGRRDGDGRVSYQHEYLPDDLFKQAISDPENYIEEFTSALLEVPLVTIFMKDIRSYREFSPSLDLKFQMIQAPLEN